MLRSFALACALLSTSSSLAVADYEETCSDVDHAGLVTVCDDSGTYAPTRCGEGAAGSFEGTYVLVAGESVADVGTASESAPSGDAVEGVFAGGALGLPYAEAFTYENNCHHGNGAAVVAFAGVAGAIVHANDAEGAAYTLFLP